MSTGKTHNGKRPVPPLKPSDLARFLEKVRVQEGPNGRFECWEWLGGHTTKTKDRPRFTMRWQGDRHAIYAYRVSWLLWRDGDRRREVSLVLDHLCGHGWCVNPDHLSLGTQGDNVLGDPNTLAHRNAHKTHCPQGHAYDEGNTFVGHSANGKPKRHCKTCQREAAKARKKKVSRRQDNPETVHGNDAP